MLPKKENILLLAKVPRFSNIGARGLILSESAVQSTSEKYQSRIRTYEDKCPDGAALPSWAVVVCLIFMWDVGLVVVVYKYKYPFRCTEEHK
jgi:hypothetical protein